MVLALLKTTVNSETYYFRGSKQVYEDTGISAATGITVADTTEQSKLPHRVPDILGHGVTVKASVSYGSGATAKTRALMCAIDKIGDIEKNLVGKTFPGTSGLITSARVKRDATFY